VKFTDPPSNLSLKHKKYTAREAAGFKALNTPLKTGLIKARLQRVGLLKVYAPPQFHQKRKRLKEFSSNPF